MYTILSVIYFRQTQTYCVHMLSILFWRMHGKIERDYKQKCFETLFIVVYE